MQVQMRKYEDDVNAAIVEDRNRKKAESQNPCQRSS